ATELGQTTLEFLLRDSNGQEILQTVSFEVVDELATEKEITSFILEGVEGTISGTDITIELPEGTDVTALVPIIIHTGASISPESETSQDFTNPVIYTVTAQDQTIQTYTVNVTVPSANQAPTAIATSDVTSGAPSLDVQFTGDTSTDPDTGDVLTYAWDFGDGSTATTVNPSHTFTTAGTYTVTLTVTDDGTPAQNSTDTITIIVTDANQAPTAVATSDVTSGAPSLDVQFTGDTSSDLDDGDVLTYAWNFGDGTIATTANPSHTFTTADTYNVTLTVTDNGTPALSSSEVSITITVNTPANQAPTAVASSSVRSAVPNFLILFTGSTSSDPNMTDSLSYAWDFGDESPVSSENNPVYSYTTAGTFNVTLTVTDNGTPNLSDTANLTIIVTAESNQLPTVFAGDDQQKNTLFSLINLSGTANDPDGTISTVLWEIESGGSATITNPNSLNTSVTNFTSGLYEFKLTVTDNLGGTNSDIVRINISDCPNSCPTGYSVCFDPDTDICTCIEDGSPEGGMQLCVD
ncbi:PKD domain-containing protein, partial [Cellulophaga sp. E16_2]|uniref:PKD domain-containing protein n=1 Tax=Cellulophaga sp. E16_2 TaxID=2789297 RepID=UPI001A920B40